MVFSIVKDDNQAPSLVAPTAKPTEYEAGVDDIPLSCLKTIDQLTSMEVLITVNILYNIINIFAIVITLLCSFL